MPGALHWQNLNAARLQQARPNVAGPGWLIPHRVHAALKRRVDWTPDRGRRSKPFHWPAAKRANAGATRIEVVLKCPWRAQGEVGDLIEQGLDDVDAHLVLIAALEA